MKFTTLAGWNVEVERTKIKEQKGGNGEMTDAPGWTLTFIEAIPGTGDRIVFTFGKDVRDFIVRELTGGVVLHGGELPRI